LQQDEYVPHDGVLPYFGREVNGVLEKKIILEDDRTRQLSFMATLDK
jgi:hypothetical protein